LKLTEFVAYYKTFFLRGYTYVSIINTVILLVLAFKSFYEPIASTGIPMPLFYAGAILAVAVLPVVVGYIDYKLISHYEYKLSWRQTRDAYKMNQKIDQLYEKLIPEEERKL
jgi:hypothetical protein